MELVSSERSALGHNEAEDNELGAVSRDIAGRLAGLDPDVVARYKRVLNEFGLASFEAAVRQESTNQRELAPRLITPHLQ